MVVARRIPSCTGPAIKYREQWLTELANSLEPVFDQYALKPYRVTCGWPCKNGLGVRKRVVGECHAAESSAGGVHELFISPLLHEPHEVGGTLAHEMAHVAAGIQAGHKGLFVRVCKYVGLTAGKPTSAMPSDALAYRIKELTGKLGAYPHSGLNPKTKLVEVKPKKDVSLSCGRCECVVRMSVKWLEAAGAPECGCGGAMVPKVQGEE